MACYVVLCFTWEPLVVSMTLTPDAWLDSEYNAVYNNSGLQFPTTCKHEILNLL